MPILIPPKTWHMMKKKQQRERRTAMARVTSITRQIKEVISIKLMSLLLILMRRVVISGARADNPLDRAGQAPPLSSC